MPHLGDIPEEAEAREFGVDNAVDDATIFFAILKENLEHALGDCKKFRNSCKYTNFRWKPMRSRTRKEAYEHRRTQY